MNRTLRLLLFTAVVFAAATFVSLTYAQGGTDAQLTVASPYDSAPAAREASIDNFSFSPATITVPQGTTLTWINHDDIPHTVVSNDQQFKSKALDTGDKFSYTFTKAGTYSYFCSIHPKMVAKVVVEAK